MSRGTILAQIQIELVIFFLQPKFIDTCKQLLVIIFTLASTNDLADSRNKTIHCCNGLSILIQFHVECLDFLRIICHEHRTFVDFLCQIALMLCLQITAPGYFVIEFIIVLGKNVDCFRIGHTGKIIAYDIFQSLKKSLVHKIIEKGHLFRCIFQYIIDDIFEHAFCKHHVILKVCKSNLRLNHPKLCGMSCRVRIFCTECRSECIDVLKCHRISLTI